jgi:hypothetical protein
MLRLYRFVDVYITVKIKLTDYYEGRRKKAEGRRQKARKFAK